MLWNLSGIELWTPEPQPGARLIAAGESRNAIVGADGSLAIWNPFSGSVVRPELAGRIIGLAGRSDRFVVLTQDGQVTAWKTAQWLDPYVEVQAVPEGLRRVIALASGDTYSMALVTPAVPEIRVHPATQIADEFSRVRMEVSVDDPVLRFQWRHNGRPISGATGPVFEIPVAWVGNHEGCMTSWLATASTRSRAMRRSSRWPRRLPGRWSRGAFDRERSNSCRRRPDPIFVRSRWAASAAWPFATIPG